MNKVKIKVYKVFLRILKSKIFRLIPDKVYLKIKYFFHMNKRLNIDNPITFNEKLQWLKLNDRKESYSSLVDKYEVRSYIKDLIGEKYLIPLYGIYEHFEQINFTVLPNEFVLKPTHTSGNIFFCRNKEILDYKCLSKEIKSWLRREYFWLHREWPYKNIKPRIVCEKYISDKNTTPDDYKVLCFNGKAKLIEVHADRFGNHSQDFYDIEWKKTNISQENSTSKVICKKPLKYDEMIYLSELIAKDFIHVRIDWFIIFDELYFGEITFYDGSGFEAFDNEEHDYLLGSWIDIKAI